MFGLFMAFAVYETYKARHIFSDQSIVYAGALRRKEIPLAGVKGYRTDDKYIHIIPTSKQYPGIRIGYTSEGYAQIQEWLADRFPDLDVQQQQQETEALRQEVEFGRDELEREANLARARQVSRALNVAGWLVGGWLFFFPKPYDWAVAVALALPPLAALVLFWHRGLIRPDERKESAYPALTSALFIPGLALLLRTLLDFELLAYQPLFPYALGAAVLLATALLLGSQRFVRANRASALLTIGAVSLLYGYAAAVAANCVFDTSGVQVHAVPVLDKHFTSGKSSTYYLNVGPWGPRPQPDDVTVTQDFYEQTAVGDSVRVYQLPGQLGASWFTTGE
ncbi:hypothetical protein [Hymenobacter rubripertinctus]|uniref:Uncharacterized protein n=1 Tax=Hymenobacter rubripertinctus TaxID=2029981 RepID=A0A418R9L6_9BACT|nr:hypothetical protein [Hymenobacter rubripertinctus]RIY14238.1 hypothetical protein D0T11_00700 [Hymenobacter rubripertinctus]